MKRPRSESMPLERSQGQTQRESKGPVLRVHCSSACPQAQPISLVSLVLRDSDSPRLTWKDVRIFTQTQIAPTKCDPGTASVRESTGFLSLRSLEVWGSLKFPS